MSVAALCPHVISLEIEADANAADIGRTLAEAHADACAMQISLVTVDLRGAGPLAVPTLQRLVAWILDIEDLPPSRRYGVHFVADGADPWQKRSLEALSACAEDAVTVSFRSGRGPKLSA